MEGPSQSHSLNNSKTKKTYMYIFDTLRIPVSLKT